MLFLLEFIIFGMNRMPFPKNTIIILMRFLFYFLLFCTLGFSLNESLIHSKEASVSFRSDAKLELIEAQSDALKGIINAEKRTFAFVVPINSFEGFNSPLQQLHFNENYLESNIYKSATFTGKIIEKIDLTRNGEYVIRAKGKLKIHGVSRERIIKSKLTIDEGVFKVKSNFSVLLSEYNIEIPRIVRQKITEEIKIAINAIFEEK